MTPGIGSINVFLLGIVESLMNIEKNISVPTNKNRVNKLHARGLDGEYTYDALGSVCAAGTVAVLLSLLL